jgi:very-short-patch-repair endonuclease
MAIELGWHRGRKLPWLPIVRFHKEVACRAEESFFSLAGDDREERWSSLENFDPDDLAGPWVLDAKDVRSQSFRLAVGQGEHESAVFIGGPCYVGSEKDFNGNWHARWRPILYREVEVRATDGKMHVIPRQAHWQLSPLIYSLLDRLSAKPAVPMEELADSVMAKAASLVASGVADQSEAVIRALVGMVPELESELTKEVRANAFRVMPTPWVLLAPANRFSALTRYLIRDYESLEGILAKDASRLGGLRLLEDRTAPDPDGDGEAMPVVPLNESQGAAVNAALGTRPLTVISGPPGCGKSQVVVSLLLNCWAEGTTVLFASNNNKAVDVVRERLERFESEFPIAVRAGARKFNNVEEVLRRTLNMAAAAKRHEATADPAAFRKRQEVLQATRKKFEEVLASKQPQRIDETVRTALTAYSNHYLRLSEAEEQRTALLNGLHALGLLTTSPEGVGRDLTASRQWIERLKEHERQTESAAARERAIRAEMPILKQRVQASLAKAGWSGQEDAPAGWLLSGPPPESIGLWESKAREVFEKPLEQDLQPLPWNVEFERWSSEENAERWEAEAREFATSIRGVCGELALTIERFEALRIEVTKARREASDHGIPEAPDIDRAALQDWSAQWAEVCSLERGQWDFLPWSRRKMLGKGLRRAESVLRTGLPVAIWARIGSLHDGGRTKLADVVESCRTWIEMRARWAEAQVEHSAIEKRFEGLRAAASQLRVEHVPTTADIASWQQVGVLLEVRAKSATLAAMAWRKRKVRETAEAELRQLAGRWVAAASGSPVKEAWRASAGREFDEAIKALAEKQNGDLLLAARKAFYATSLATLTEPWSTAIEAQREIGKLQGELERMPTLASRVAAWGAERQPGGVLPAWDKASWPADEEREQWAARISEVAGWCDRWGDQEKKERPALMAAAEQELAWARQSLQQAASLLPAVTDYDGIRQLVAQSVSANATWPTAKITEGFRKFSPEIIKAKIDSIDAELERGSFDEAKARWLERLEKDTEAVQAVDELERALRQQRGELRANQVGMFKEALKLVPIWITTAQAPQAIPLEPQLFDLVVIDEASQCTLTNLLPLMYRAKRLVVLGDENQLPAIPNMQKTEELMLAKKFEIEEHLSIIGHAENNVYSTASETLPRKRADVEMLVEHFRSHPQIIGFSNREIYGKRLVLKKGIKESKTLPFGGGVHRVPVRGQVERGERGRSWRNVEEGKVAIAQVQSIRAQAPHLSIGVVTPFAAQKEWLRERVQEMGLASEVLVDTAYGFQGDERDVIIFSPVVAKGITASACRWVESPPNLVNVALTRAREALFVVADFDYCMQQEGILKKLAVYCKEVQLLRDTSPAELELFSWLILEGLTPTVHPRVGDHEVDFELRADSGVRLAIEVDGAEHHDGREARDNAIDAYLEGRGYRVLRVPARAVLETPHEVVHRIREMLAT